MSTIKYTYKVIEVSDKSMTVEFSSEGLQTYVIGCRKPSVGESIDDVMASYAPTHAWAVDKTEYQNINIGVSGDIEHRYEDEDEDVTDGMTAEELLAHNKKAKLDDLAENRYTQEEQDSVTVSGHSISTSRSTQSRLSALMIELANGTYTPVVWKTADGQFINLSDELLKEVHGAVNMFVQDLFAQESVTAGQINSASTQAELDAVTI